MSNTCITIAQDEFASFKKMCVALTGDSAQRYVLNDTPSAPDVGCMYGCGCIAVNSTFARLSLLARDEMGAGVEFFVRHEQCHRSDGRLLGRFTVDELLDGYFHQAGASAPKCPSVGPLFVDHLLAHHSRGSVDLVIMPTDFVFGLMGRQDPDVERSADLAALDMVSDPVDALSSAVALIARTTYERKLTTPDQRALWRSARFERRTLSLYLDSHDLRSHFSGAEVAELERQTSIKSDILDGIPSSLLRCCLR